MDEKTLRNVRVKLCLYLFSWSDLEFLMIIVTFLLLDSQQCLRCILEKDG